MVLGAGGPAADNYIKSLRLADPDIYTLGVDTHPLMLELSCASETVCIDTQPSDHEDHHKTIVNLCVEYDITMIHAQPDQEVRFLARNVADWSKMPITLPHWKVIEACQDKLRCADLLGDLAPASHSYQLADVLFPAWMRARTGAGSLAAKLVEDVFQAAAWEGVWKGRVARDDFMLSEYLPGEDRSYTGVWWRGEPIASACRVRVEYADTRTPSGQCSSPRIAKLDSRPETFEVAEAAIRRVVAGALEHVPVSASSVPHGVFYVDMREAADGRLLVTEINAGRFNTTQNFYAEAGCNLPWEHACQHHGQSANPYRLLRPEDDVYWVRQPDMGHKLVEKTRVTA